MADVKPVQVFPRGDEWAVSREGNKKVTSAHPTREQAEKQGRVKAREDGAEIRIYDEQGEILVQEDYGLGLE